MTRFMDLTGIRQLILQHRFHAARERLDTWVPSPEIAVDLHLMYVESFLAQGFIKQAMEEINRRQEMPEIDPDTRICLGLYETMMGFHTGKARSTYAAILAQTERLKNDTSLRLYTKTFAHDMANRANIMGLSFGLVSPLERAYIAARTEEVIDKYKDIGRMDKVFASRERLANLWLADPLSNREAGIKQLETIQNTATNEGWKIVAAHAEMRLATLSLEDLYNQGGTVFDTQIKALETAAKMLEESGRVGAEAFVEGTLGLLLLKYAIPEGEQLSLNAAEKLDFHSDLILLNNIWNHLHTWYIRKGDEEGARKTIVQRREIQNRIATPMIKHNQRLAEAEEAFRYGKIAEAKAILNELIADKESYHHFGSISILANTVGAINNRDEALTFLEKAVDELRPNGPNTFLSHVYFMQAAQCMDGKPAQALTYLEKALEVDRALSDQKGEGQHLGMRAWVKARLRHLTKQRPVVNDEIAQDFKKATDCLLPHKDIESLEELANICQQRGQAYMFGRAYAQSEFWFDQALAVASSAGLLMKKANIEAGLALNFVSVGRDEKSKTAYQAAYKYVQQAIQFYQTSMLQDMKWRILFHQGIVVEEWGRMEAVGSDEQKRLWNLAEDAYEQSAEIVRQMRTDASSDSGILRQQILVRFGYNKQTLLRAAFIFNIIYRKNNAYALKWLERMKNQALLDGLVEREQMDTAQLLDTSFNWETCRNLLQNEEKKAGGKRIVLISYYLDPHICMVLGMRSDWQEPIYEQIPIERTQFMDFIQQHFRRPDGVRQLLADIGEGPWQSFQSIIDPVGRWTNPGDIVCLVPYGDLHDLPLHTLKINEQYLIERNPVFYCPSLAVFQYVCSSSSRHVNALPTNMRFMGDPSGDLPFARKEVEYLSSMFHRQPLVGSEITVETMLKSLEEDDWLHFAGHGDLSITDGFDSGLRLSDGIFRARDMFGIKANMQLAILSGCETGVSHRLQGDELFGMVHAMLYAGVKAMLVSQWRVSDEATRALFVAFYQTLIEHPEIPKVVAFQQAIVKNIANHPQWNFYHWGGFVLIGDWK